MTQYYPATNSISHATSSTVELLHFWWWLQTCREINFVFFCAKLRLPLVHYCPPLLFQSWSHSQWGSLVHVAQRSIQKNPLLWRRLSRLMKMQMIWKIQLFFQNCQCLLIIWYFILETKIREITASCHIFFSSRPTLFSSPLVARFLATVGLPRLKGGQWDAMWADKVTGALLSLYITPLHSKVLHNWPLACFYLRSSEQWTGAFLGHRVPVQQWLSFVTTQRHLIFNWFSFATRPNWSKKVHKLPLLLQLSVFFFFFFLSLFYFSFPFIFFFPLLACIGL